MTATSNQTATPARSATDGPTALDKTLYTAVVTATGGRSGHARSDDGALDVPIAPPRDLGGDGSPGTNPEQLFAAGYAACFGSALANVAAKAGVDLGEVAIAARVSIGPAGRGFGLAVELTASLPDLPREQAEALLARAHEVCPYSNAIRGNVVVDLRLA